MSGVAREAARRRQAAILLGLVRDFGPRIELDWGPRQTPWEACVVRDRSRVIARNSIRYWCEQGWASRVDGLRGTFTLTVEVGMVPELEERESA